MSAAALTMCFSRESELRNEQSRNPSARWLLAAAPFDDWTRSRNRGFFCCLRCYDCGPFQSHGEHTRRRSTNAHGRQFGRHHGDCRRRAVLSLEESDLRIRFRVASDWCINLGGGMDSRRLCRVAWQTEGTILPHSPVTAYREVEGLNAVWVCGRTFIVAKAAKAKASSGLAAIIQSAMADSSCRDSICTRSGFTAGW